LGPRGEAPITPPHATPDNREGGVGREGERKRGGERERERKSGGERTGGQTWRRIPWGSMMKRPRRATPSLRGGKAGGKERGGEGGREGGRERDEGARRSVWTGTRQIETGSR
jgi:hypothetical protein